MYTDSKYSGAQSSETLSSNQSDLIFYLLHVILFLPFQSI